MWIFVGWNEFSSLQSLYHFLRYICRVDAYDPLGVAVSSFTFSPLALKKPPSVTLGAFNACVCLSLAVPTDMPLEIINFGDATVRALPVENMLSEDGGNIPTT